MILAIEDLHFKYGDTPILDGLSMGVAQGTIHGIVGASGSGKTTLIRLVAGIIKPLSGSIKVFGDVPSQKIWDRIGYMPQMQALYADLTVQHNVDFFARMFGVARTPERTEIVEDTIRKVSLWEKRKESIAKLSGGERQRVSLAIALVHNPPLLLLDEPTVGLDPKLRVDLWQHFHDLTAEGTTIIISSHVMDDARRCDQVGFLHLGRMIAVGTPSALVEAIGTQGSNLEDAFLYFINKVGER